MENVHGIAVAGGSFPAEIWRCFMERAPATRRRRTWRCRARSRPGRRGTQGEVRHPLPRDDHVRARTTTTTTPGRPRRRRPRRRRRRPRRGPGDDAAGDHSHPDDDHGAGDHGPAAGDGPAAHDHRRRLRDPVDHHLRPGAAVPAYDTAVASRCGRRCSPRRCCSAPSPCRAGGSFAGRSFATSTSTGIRRRPPRRATFPSRGFFVEYPPGAIALFAGPSRSPPGARTTRSSRALMTLCSARITIFCVTYVLARQDASGLGIGAASALPRARPHRPRARVAEHLRRLHSLPSRHGGGVPGRRAGLGSRSRCSALPPPPSSTRCCSCRWRSSGSGGSDRSWAGPLVLLPS